MPWVGWETIAARWQVALPPALVVFIVGGAGHSREHEMPDRLTSS